MPPRKSTPKHYNLQSQLCKTTATPGLSDDAVYQKSGPSRLLSGHAPCLDGRSVGFGLLNAEPAVNHRVIITHLAHAQWWVGIIHHRAQNAQFVAGTMQQLAHSRWHSLFSQKGNRAARHTATTHGPARAPRGRDRRSATPNIQGQSARNEAARSSQAHARQ